jgi:hypothetical protein
MKLPALALCIATSLSLTLAMAPAWATEQGNSQQNKMAACNKEAGDKALKGDARKDFMKTCLSAKKMSQQDKMKACNVDAKDKKGDERKAFMSECLKG